MLLSIILDGPLIKFSETEDLTDEVCQELLQLYMPEHIRKNKVTQRLFIKYVC